MVIKDEDLHSFGWAPGHYVFKCYDKIHNGDQDNFMNKPMGAKYCLRCRECAVKRLEMHIMDKNAEREDQLNS